MTTDLIAPSQIQSELTRIWESLEGTNKMRASLFNLIFYTKKKVRAQYIRNTAQRVIERFPSRVIFITCDTETSENYLHTRAYVVSSVKGEVDIACDFIQIDVAGTHQERIPFLILPHIIPDLPIYVIWAEDPQESSPLLAQMQKLANRLIFDSECSEDLPGFAKKLLQFNEIPQLDIADLNWARMESWRNLLTSTFYTSERLKELKKTSEIQIVYNAQESQFCYHTQIQAFYLQGWIATQLGWELEKKEETNNKLSFHYKRDQTAVRIYLLPKWHETIKPGSILSIDIRTEKEQYFSFKRNLDMPHHVTMHFSTLEKCDIPLRYFLSKEESGQSLVKEICHNGTSQHYLNLLKQIQSE